MLIYIYSFKCPLSEYLCKIHQVSMNKWQLGHLFLELANCHGEVEHQFGDIY